MDKFKTILGLIFIGGIVLIPIDKSPNSQYSKDWAKIPAKIQQHFADCSSPGGINEQIEKYGTFGTYSRGIRSFNDGKGHYASYNRHQSNNRNRANYADSRVEEDHQYYDRESNQYLEQVDTTGFGLPTILRKGLMILFIVYLGWYVVVSLKETRGG